MPSNLRVISAKDFISASPKGNFDLESSRRLLQAIAVKSAELGQHDVIIDIRNAHSNMTAADLWSLATSLTEEYRSLACKTAILCPLERFDRAWFFVQCTEHKDMNLNAFTDYEAAMKWLQGDVV